MWMCIVGKSDWVFGIIGRIQYNFLGIFSSWLTNVSVSGQTKRDADFVVKFKMFLEPRTG